MLSARVVGSEEDVELPQDLAEERSVARSDAEVSVVGEHLRTACGADDETLALGARGEDLVEEDRQAEVAEHRRVGGCLVGADGRLGQHEVKHAADLRDGVVQRDADARAERVGDDRSRRIARDLEVGDADDKLQAYCYRMVMTNVPENRVPIEKPAAYNEADFELLFRAIEAGQKGNFFKTSPIPNHKTDSNNTGGISCDWIGGNYGEGWNWATLNHTEREALAAKHRDWQLGLVWTLQNHPRVPENIRKDTAPWGLAKDEFADNGHWPYNLYVREARRMVSGFVMTEKHCDRTFPVEDPVGMGAYTLDSHNTQRFVHNGMVKNEGDIQTHLKDKPYGISYRSIVPKVGECENLLMPWALSATHIAFGSIRMEPVFMILSQSAATAACMAIDSGTSVQDVPYADLRARLLKDDQRLEYAD